MAKQGQGGRSFSVLDIITAYKAGVSAQGGKGGRSISNLDYQTAAAAAGFDMMKPGMKPKKKSPAMKWSPKGGKGMKKGGKVKRKA